MKGFDVMIITIDNAVKEMYFMEISEGEFFAPFPNSVYLKVQRDALADGNLVNAIDMEGGHLAHFDDMQEVYPLEGTINLSYSCYGYEIEN